MYRLYLMKKLFSILFAIVFLFSLMSFFSQKSHASVLCGSITGEYCTSSSSQTCPNGTSDNSTCSVPYQCCKADSVPVDLVCNITGRWACEGTRGKSCVPSGATNRWSGGYDCATYAPAVAAGKTVCAGGDVRSSGDDFNEYCFAPPPGPLCTNQGGTCTSVLDAGGCPGGNPGIANASGCGGGVCCLMPTCENHNPKGICVERSHASAYGTKITDVAPCNPAGTDADPVECYNPPDVIPPATCKTDPAKPQTLLNGTCYNNCSGSCQAGDKNYCSPSAGDPENLPAADNPPTAYGPHDPTGDAYCNASTNGGHGFCCAATCPAGQAISITSGVCAPSCTSLGGYCHEPDDTEACPAGDMTADTSGCSSGVCCKTGGGGRNPSPPANPGDTIIKFVIGLDGIGTSGDQVNPDWTPKAGRALGSNFNLHRSHDFVVFINGQTHTGSLTFDNTSTDPNYGLFTGSVDLGTSFATGSYTVKISSNGHLIKQVPGTVTITAGSTTNIPHKDPATGALLNLVTGDVVTANVLDIYSYTTLLSCLSDKDINDFDKQLTCNRDANFPARADLEDNGAVDKYDYNLFVREIFKIRNGD